MNNNLSLSDLQNKYRDKKASTVGKFSDSQFREKVESKKSDSINQTVVSQPKFGGQGDNNYRKNITSQNLQTRELTAQKELNTDQGSDFSGRRRRLDEKNKIPLRKFDKGKQHVNEGPIMAFLLFSGLAMFAGVVLLVTNNISAAKSPQVLGQSTGIKSTAKSQSSIVDEVQKSINKTNDEYQKKYQEIKNKVNDQIENEINPVETEDVSGEDLQSVENPAIPNQKDIIAAEENISAEKESMPPVVQEEPLVIVRVKSNAQGGVNLRSEPHGVVKASALSGEEFELVSEQNGWVEIKYSENENYWTLADLVEKV